MTFIQAIIDNPVKVTVGVLLVALFGSVALLRMPMELTPEVQTPTITVTTLWPGASPQEVEREIVTEQEEQLKGVAGVTKMSSSSSDSQGIITLEFLVGTDMSESLLKVNSRLQQVPEYPEDADQPVITAANSADQPIAWFILSDRPPTSEAFAAFRARHPHLSDPLAEIETAHNIGLAALRLRRLAAADPTFAELMPAEALNVETLKRFAEDEIEARFERVAGVSQSNVFGGLEDELQVIVDPIKLAARRLTLTAVRDVLRNQNADISGGDFWEGKRRWVVRSLGQFRSPEQVGRQLLAMRDGAPVYVSDVAEVRKGFKKPNAAVRRFGESSIAINCVRESGANVLDVMDGLRRTTAELNETLLNPRNLQLTLVYDETDYINSSVQLVRRNMFVGGALTMVVLMLFLHLGSETLLLVPVIVGTALAAVYASPWFFVVCLAVLVGAGFWRARGALVVGLAIPTSIVGTFLVLGILGRSLNVITLAGMAFAVGMLVDNAVVVLENIFRRHASGESPFTAAARGTQEVWGAVLASTLTTVAVFLPVVFVQEEAGQLFRDIALAITGGVSLSLLVSITLIPTLAARLFHSGAERDGATLSAAAPSRLNPSRLNPSRLNRRLTQLGNRCLDAIALTNAWIQRGWARRIVVVGVLATMSVCGSWYLWPKVEYLPTGNRNLVIGILIPPPGYNIEELMAMGESVEAGLMPYMDVDLSSDIDAELDFPIVDDFFFVAAGRSVFMGIRAWDSSRAAELVPLVQRLGSRLPGTFAIAKQTSLFEQGLSKGRTIDIEITGPDLERLVGLGGQILGQVMGILPTSQARPVPSLDLSSPELHVIPKLVEAADLQVNSADLGFAVNALVDGAYAGDYYDSGKKIDLTIMGETQYASATQDISALPIATPTGQLVQLSSVARVALSSGPEQVDHRERVRAITIEVSPPPEVALEDAMLRINSEIVTPLRASGQLQGGYQLTLAGTADKLRQTWSALRFNIVLALVITYLLMAALFESWLYPFVIILSVPLGAVGGILGLNVLNIFLLQPLDVLTMLGFVILIGTVVNNPILIVHQSLNHMRDSGMDANAAILESVRTRVRPIMMTTTTTVLGLLPLVLFPGAGSELYRGLGSVVLGGLVVSAVFTLFFVPALFSLTMEAKRGIARVVLANAATIPTSTVQPAAQKKSA